MRGEVEAGKRVIEGQKLFLVEKEREWQAKHSRATQNHLREIATLEQEKHNAELRAKEFEQIVSAMKVELQHKTETFAEERKGLVGDRTETAKVLDELRLKFIYFQRMEDSFGKLRTDHGRLLEEVRELLGQIAGAEESLRGLHTAKSGLEEQIMEFDKRESEFQSTLSHMAAHHHQDKSALLQEWQVKNKDAANVMKELEHTEGEQKREILLLRDSIKELIERQNLFKKRTEIVIGELVAALKTKAALVEMTRAAVSPATHKKVKDELAHVKSLLERVRGIAVPNRVTNETLYWKPVDRKISAKEGGKVLDERIYEQGPSPWEIPASEADDLRALFDRLRPLGFSENATMDDHMIFGD